jgi:hypothetical protein
MIPQNDSKKTWETYCENELARIRPILAQHGFTLDDTQPHISGERYLMQAVTTASGKKLILLGKDTDGGKVVIKATRDEAGIHEILNERSCRDLLKKIDFAGDVFHTPEELALLTEDGYTISIQRFIDQECSFLERPLETQFDLVLKAFKSQESAHATTWQHRARIHDTFSIRDVRTYLHTFATFKANIKMALPTHVALHTLLDDAEALLRENNTIIEQYSGFLTHTDFVPHNIRISGGTIYLLDHSSLTFGNKYEGWARFLNFMTLYNPSLESALVQYVKDNRTPEESVSLRMMRIYRLGEIIWYYIRTLDSSSNDLLILNTERIHFWTEILSYMQRNIPVPESLVENYKAKRDSLRSDDEKRRQKGLH